MDNSDLTKWPMEDIFSPPRRSSGGSRLAAEALKDKKGDVVTLLNDKPVTFQFEVLSPGSLIHDPHPEEDYLAEGK